MKTFFNKLYEDWYYGKPLSKFGLIRIDPNVIKYVFEPYWISGRGDLQGVVMNYNPGRGGGIQERQNINYTGDYVIDIINNPNFKKTDDWHLNLRAKPILNALKCHGSIKCIEIFWGHTPTVKNGLIKHVKDNPDAIFKSFYFAAEESKKVKNNKLNSVVLMKMSKRGLIEILKLANIKYKEVKNTQYASDNVGAWYEIMIDNIPDVKFVTIWNAKRDGSKQRSSFPPTFLEIFNKI